MAIASMVAWNAFCVRACVAALALLCVSLRESGCIQGECVACLRAAAAILVPNQTHASGLAQVWSEEADGQRTDLVQRLAATSSALEELRASSAAAAELANARHEEEVAVLRQRLEQAQGAWACVSMCCHRVCGCACLYVWVCVYVWACVYGWVGG